jgi:hypothetical protein
MARLSKSLVTVALAAVVTSGCLLKDVTQTWYIEPAGAVTWVVLEKDVRSDANAPADRIAEEGAYWTAVQQNSHPIAAGLRELGASHPRTVVLRGDVPYSVQTEGRFDGLDVLGQRLIAGVGASGSSVITRNGTTWEWTMVVRDPKAEGATVEPSEGIKALTENMDALKVVLIAGRFESAQGFSISNDQRTATWVESQSQSKQDEENPTITLKLKWKSGL